MQKTVCTIAIIMLIAIIVTPLIIKSVNKKNKNKGIIIILNGPSASGKSSIQKELASLFDKPYLKIGIDNFFVGVLPEKYIFGPLPENPEDIVMKGTATQDENGPLFKLEFGPEGEKIISGMHHAIAAYAKQANNIIVDYILYEQPWLKELVYVLKDYKVYFIGIELPLEILQEREKARNTSPVGHARTHYKTVHEHNIYDLIIDTSKLTAKEAAIFIKHYIHNTQDPQAFKKLGKLYHTSNIN